MNILIGQKMKKIMVMELFSIKTVEELDSLRQIFNSVNVQNDAASKLELVKIYKYIFCLKFFCIIYMKVF